MASKFSLQHVLAAGLSIFLTAAAPNAAFAGGGADAGGGSNTKPSFDEIREMATSLVQDTEWSRTTFNLPMWPDADRVPVADPKILAKIDPSINLVMNKMRLDYLYHGKPSPAEIRFDFRTHGSCQGLDGEQDASTAMCAPKGAPICLSLEGIREHVPKATLKLALEALIMHELAHQHCANEADAQKIEHLFSTGLAQNSKLIESMKLSFGWLRAELRKVLRQLDGSGGSVSDAYLCSLLGQYDGTVLQTSQQLQLLDVPRSADIVDAMLQDHTFELLGSTSGAFRMRGFCGTDGGYSKDAKEYIPEGDRVKLRATVQDQIRLLNLAEGHIKEFIGVTIWKAMNGQF